MLTNVSQAGRGHGAPPLPFVMRIPPWQPAALILVATALLALIFHGSFSAGAVLMMAVIAAAALVGAAFAVRLVLVADDDGIWIRRFWRERLLAWNDISTIEMTAVHGNSVTVRITRRNGSYVDVPSSLVLPTLPTGIRKARSRVSAVAMRLTELAQRERT
jgi:hypothetical protein